MYIFYNSKDLQIMGASTSELSMEFPYIEVEEIPHTLDSIILKKKGKGVIVEENKGMTLEKRIKRDQNYQIK